MQNKQDILNEFIILHEGSNLLYNMVEGEVEYMDLPDMRYWIKESKDKAMKAFEERDKLFGWDKEGNNLAIVGKDGYDEEDLSRDSQGL